MKHKRNKVHEDYVKKSVNGWVYESELKNKDSFVVTKMPDDYGQKIKISIVLEDVASMLGKQN